MQAIGLGKRHLQYLLLFLGGLIAFTIRSSLSVAIVAMIDDNPPYPDIITYPEWKNKDVILSSFFWGYLIFQIPAGLIGYKYGPKYFLGTAFTVGSIFTLLSPLMAKTIGSSGIILSRVVQGLSQGFLFPSIHSILSKWTPLPERSRAFSFVYSSIILGTSIGMPITGYICSSSYGWPMVFYLSGTMGLIWSLAFFCLCENCPQDDNRISAKERAYLEEHILACHNQEKISIPWKSMFTSIHFWSIVVAAFGNNYGFLTLLTEIPSFMQGILKFDIKANSKLSALPFLAAFIVASICSPISDFLITRKILSIQSARKFFNSIGLYIPAVALICLAYMPPEMKSVAVLLLVIAVGMNASIFVGFNVNHIDIAPSFAGILMGFSNCIGQVGSILGPLMVQIIVKDVNDPLQWRMVFMIAAAVFIASNSFFLIFASGEVQPWNLGVPDKSKKLSICEYTYLSVGESIKMPTNQV